MLNQPIPNLYQVKCTSHPELNYTRDSDGGITNRILDGHWTLLNHGYDIEVTKGMTIELECTNGATFTVTL